MASVPDERRHHSAGIVVGRMGAVVAWVRGGLQRHRRVVAIVGSLIAAGVLGVILAGHRDDFATALARASLGVLALAAALQVVALLARTEAWHRTIEAAVGAITFGLRRVSVRAAVRSGRCRSARASARGPPC